MNEAKSANAWAEALQARVGKIDHVGDWFEMTQDRIDQFSAATLDDQWIHTDPERAARESPFGCTIAHGFLTLSLIPHLARLGRDPEDESETYRRTAKLAVNYGLNRLRFPAPVKVGARLRAKSELAAVTEVKGNGIQLVTKVTIEVDGQPKPACVAESLVRFYY